MKRSPINHMRLALMAGCATVAFAPTLAAAQAGTFVTFDIPAQDLDGALTRFGQQSEREIIISSQLSRNRRAPAVQGKYTPEEALGVLLAQSGLTYRMSSSGSIVVEADADPQGGSAAGGGAEVEGLIVTAQKREENIQDVPIAMSAFSQETLTDRQVAGGPDLITQIPNMSFTKTNFTSYSIQIRGIGTQAISATTDPAVAVAFNNTPFIHNRFFEQEFYDLERLEVLRGPQGTLYGRNATAGVVNLISAKPKFSYAAKASVDVSNYNSSRLEGMINIPLVEDVVALRLAGAWTRRDGYATNQLTGKQIDGRDLWSTRLSLRFEPTDWISANLIWEHFEEADDRLRSGKQLCKKDLAPAEIGGIPVHPTAGGAFGAQSYLSQGCLPVSLYSEEAFQTPNGYSLPFYGPTGTLANPVFPNKDPYLNATQSRDLRVIESTVEPDYRASTDLAEFQIAIDLSDNLTLNSETAYNADFLFSLQDYNRFTTAPNAFDPNPGFSIDTVRPGLISSEGVFCDPQLGCSDRLLLVDLSTAESAQFSQEFRLGSDFDGPFNFSLGANYLRFDTENKYYVFINSLSMFAALGNSQVSYPWIPGTTDNSQCTGRGGRFGTSGTGPVGDLAPIADPSGNYSVVSCNYIDPNPIGALNDQGRNYFLSKNPYKLVSYAAFGEIYYDLASNLKLTGGLRWTVDRKTAPQVPSWLLASKTAGAYPTKKTVFQEWREPTGRLTIDWKPDLGFTEQTLLYASYAHGYKAGGANPPPPVIVTYGGVGTVGNLPDNGETFGPEFVDAFEVGTKNTLLDGALTLNLTGFYYDYKGYQISQILDRSAINSNFDTEVWGLELEADWRPVEALRLGVKGGYQKTRLADGSSSIDLIDRTAGHDDWIVIRPFPTIPSNCIIPVEVATAGGVLHFGGAGSGSANGGPCIDAYYLNYDPITGLPYVPYPTEKAPPEGAGGGDPVPIGPGYEDYAGFDPTTAPNNGKGFSKDLSGNELPNAPNYTATVTADYTLPLRGDWLMTFHGDYHYQSESWARVINSDPYDRIKAFSTVNASAIFTNEDAGWKVMAYVKNVFDETAITGAFLNSDDTGLTTNVFLTEPRLYGLRVTKDFTGGGWLGSLSRHEAGEPYLFTVEIGGGVARYDGETENYAPDWLDLYGPNFVFPLDPQDEDLDLGDTRSVKLTYAPNSDWRISAGYRYGKTNGQDRAAAPNEKVPGGFSQKYSTLCHCNPYVTALDNVGISAVRDSEEHTIADFVVGKEIGVGTWGRGESVLGLGVRYADFRSTSDVGMDGIPDSYIRPSFPDGFPGDRRHEFTTTLWSDRDFEGVGPVLSWEASQQLLGSDESGWASLDWSLRAGVLFGKQTVASNEERLGEYYYHAPVFNSPLTRAIVYDDVVPRARSEDATVPNVSVSLGLSYAIDRVKVSTGYSYDRFFDVIDGGYEEAQQFDRTIHGPYLKLSLGFGG